MPQSEAFTIFIAMMRDSFLNKKFKYTYSNAAIYIVLINVLVFFAVNYTNIAFKGVRLVYWLSLIPGCINMGWVWQFLTYMFVHGSVWHLFFNMFALIMFGRTLERFLGTREFVLFYFLCGILGGVISYVFYLVQGVTGIAVMGASGSIYALLFLCAVLFPSARLLLFFKDTSIGFGTKLSRFLINLWQPLILIGLHEALCQRQTNGSGTRFL